MPPVSGWRTPFTERNFAPSAPTKAHAMSNPPPDDRPYSVKQLAERWGCTRHVHKIIRRSELRAFKVGDKLLRVLAD